MKYLLLSAGVHTVVVQTYRQESNYPWSHGSWSSVIIRQTQQRRRKAIVEYSEYSTSSPLVEWHATGSA